MSTSTTRLGLTKPSGSAAPEEIVDIGVINTNMDAIDEWMGCILVNDGVTPATGDLFDGAIVKERTSGIVWEARRNGGGTFDKYYVVYPYQLYIYGQVSVATATHTEIPLTAANLQTGKSVNASTAQINGSSYFVVPVKGIWRFHLHYSFDSNATGYRAGMYKVNGTLKNGDADEVIIPAVNGTNTKFVNLVTDVFSVGDTIVPDVYHTAGVNVLTTVFFVATLMEPRT